MADLKVLMIGGRRCGKTATLASIFHEITHGLAHRYFTISDQTVLDVKNGQESLTTKRAEIEDFLYKAHNTFLVDENPTKGWGDYTLQLQIPGTNRKMSIRFRDASGEYFEATSPHREESERFIADCDIYIVAIDTPYLMAPYDTGLSNSLCSRGISDLTNRVADIHNYLTHIDDNEGQDAKMVIFVPIKCEKWAREGRLAEVTAHVKETYGTTIEALKQYKKMTVEILPIETIGNVVFSEFREALIYTDPITKKKQRCCKLSDKIIRLDNGTSKPIRPTDVLTEDNTATLAGSSLVRPYAWYTVNPQNNAYAPHNCDQIPLHILRFMIGKFRDSGIQIHKSGFWNNLWRRIKALFGSITPDELENAINHMNRDGIIKHSGEGIDIIKQVF